MVSAGSIPAPLLKTKRLMKVASTIKIPVKISNGKFASNLNTIGDILKHYEGCTIDITFKKRSNKRSNHQNSYYFGVIVTIMRNCIKEEWGEIWSLNETHEFLKANCNFEEKINEDTGEVLRKTKSTTENDTKNQEEFHEKCRQLAYNFFNTTIPLPNEDVELNF